MCRWTQRILQEFFEQGDQERRLGLPISPMMDRTASSPAQTHINFIEFIVAPLYHGVSLLWVLLGKGVMSSLGTFDCLTVQAQRLHDCGSNTRLTITSKTSLSFLSGGLAVGHGICVICIRGMVNAGKPGCADIAHPGTPQPVPHLPVAQCGGGGQVVALLPELDSRFTQLLKNRQMWHDRYMAEVEDDGRRSFEEKVADQVRLLRACLCCRSACSSHTAARAPDRADQQGEPSLAWVLQARNASRLQAFQNKYADEHAKAGLAGGLISQSSLMPMSSAPSMYTRYVDANASPLT